jgi:hypothetical protein
MQRKRRLPALFSVLMLFSLLGCNLATQLPSSQSTPTIQVPPNLPDSAAKNSSQALENVARIIYDALADGQNLNSYISGVMTAFDAPPLGEADIALVKKRYNQGLPLMFIPQVAEMADAYNDGGYVNLDAFITAANTQGAKQQGTNDPLTREYLTQKFGDYEGKAQYATGQVLPAFVLALGRERATRFPPENADPLWGDGLLDPLQLTLLLYSISYSSSGPLSAKAPLTADIAHQDVEISFVKDPIQAALMASVPGSDPIVDWIKDQIEDEVTGEVQDFVEVPLDKAEAAQVSVCASLLLYGHQLKVTTTPKLIYHNDGSKPWSTRVDVTLAFQDDYWDNYLQIDRWMLENLGNCKLPRRGPVEGKPLEWSVSDGLSDHGNFNITPSQTGGDGKASANWQTVPETTPKAQRTFDNQRDAVGAVIVRAGSLVPGWSGLERIVGLLKDTGNTGDSPLTVIYYVGQGYKAIGQEGTQIYSGVICDLEQPFTVNATSPYYVLPIQLVPSSAEAGSFSYSYTFSSGATVTGQGRYTVNGDEAGAHQLILNVEDLIATFQGAEAHEAYQMHIDLVPLTTQECGNP